MDLSSSAAAAASTSDTPKPQQETESASKPSISQVLPAPAGGNKIKLPTTEPQSSSIPQNLSTEQALALPSSSEVKGDGEILPGRTEPTGSSLAEPTEATSTTQMSPVSETIPALPTEEGMDVKGASISEKPMAKQESFTQGKAVEQQPVAPSPKPPVNPVQESVLVKPPQVEETTKEQVDPSHKPVDAVPEPAHVSEKAPDSGSIVKLATSAVHIPRPEVQTVTDSKQETASTPASNPVSDAPVVSKQISHGSSPDSDPQPIVEPEKGPGAVTGVKPVAETVSIPKSGSEPVSDPEAMPESEPVSKPVAKTVSADTPTSEAFSAPKPVKQHDPARVTEPVSTNKPVTESKPAPALPDEAVSVAESMDTEPASASHLNAESASQSTAMDALNSDSAPAASDLPPGRPLGLPSASLPAPAPAPLHSLTKAPGDGKDPEKPSVLPENASNRKDLVAENPTDDSEKVPIVDKIAAPSTADVEKESDKETTLGEAKAVETPSPTVPTPKEEAPKDKGPSEYKLPIDAPPSMEDSLDSRGAQSTKSSTEGSGKTGSLEEAMETEMADKTAAGVPFISEDSSKDHPPLDFKPFSHYTQDGKFIDKVVEEGKTDKTSAPEKPVSSTPSVSAADSAAVSVSNEPMSVDDSSFPEASEVSESVPSTAAGFQPADTSQFQGQFMDFLKGNDNATQHSFKGSEGGDSASVTAEDAAKVGGEVTAPEESSQPSTPSTPSRGRGGRRGRGRGRRNPTPTADGASQQATDETSNMSNQSETQKRSARKRKPKEAGKEDEADGKGNESLKESPKRTVESNFPADRLFEYQWPQIEKNADWFFLQEHLSAFLGVTSFKRKYRDLTRRPIGMNERNFLQESGVVSEMQCDLGLTALKSDQVYELLLKDFPEKYQEYAEVLHAREQERIKEKNKSASDMAKVDKNNIVDVVSKAVRSAAEFNAQFMRERREERRAYFDLQTHEIHYPLSTLKKVPPSATKVSAYPVALIPGQFQEYYRKYTPQQLKYFPLNTATYDPPRHLKTIFADPADKYESELDSQSASSRPVDIVGNISATSFPNFQMLNMGDADEGSSSSGSSSGSGSDGDSDSSSDGDDQETTPTPAPPPPPSSTKKSTRTPRGKKFVAPPAGAQAAKDVNAICNICQGNSEKNKIGEAEELVKCSECGRHGHPSCLELTEEMIPNIKTYPWQCMECKTCVECMDPYDEDKMMFCDHCDRGYHTFCVGLRSIPTGRWECPSCRPDPPTKKRKR